MRNRSLTLLMSAIALVAFLALTFVGASISSAQQPPPGFDPSQMEEMMKRFQDPAAIKKIQEQAEAASRCLKDVSEKQLKDLQARAQAASQEIDALCKAGKKAQALKQGLELSQEMNTDPTILKLRKCSDSLGDMMEGMPGLQMDAIKAAADDKKPTENDICS